MERIRLAVEAFNRRDVDAMLRSNHPEVVYQTLLHPWRARAASTTATKACGSGGAISMRQWMTFTATWTSSMT